MDNSLTHNLNENNKSEMSANRRQKAAEDVHKRKVPTDLELEEEFDNFILEELMGQNVAKLLGCSTEEITRLVNDIKDMQKCDLKEAKRRLVPQQRQQENLVRDRSVDNSGVVNNDKKGSAWLHGERKSPEPKYTARSKRSAYRIQSGRNINVDAMNSAENSKLTVIKKRSYTTLKQEGNDPVRKIESKSVLKRFEMKKVTSTTPMVNKPAIIKGRTNAVPKKDTKVKEQNTKIEIFSKKSQVRRVKSQTPLRKKSVFIMEKETNLEGPKGVTKIEVFSKKSEVKKATKANTVSGKPDIKKNKTANLESCAKSEVKKNKKPPFDRCNAGEKSKNTSKKATKLRGQRTQNKEFPKRYEIEIPKGSSLLIVKGPNKTSRVEHLNPESSKKVAPKRNVETSKKLKPRFSSKKKEATVGNRTNAAVQKETKTPRPNTKTGAPGEARIIKAPKDRKPLTKLKVHKQTGKEQVQCRKINDPINAKRTERLKTPIVTQEALKNPIKNRERKAKTLVTAKNVEANKAKVYKPLEQKDKKEETRYKNTKTFTKQKEVNNPKPLISKEKSSGPFCNRQFGGQQKRYVTVICKGLNQIPDTRPNNDRHKCYF